MIDRPPFPFHPSPELFARMTGFIEACKPYLTTLLQQRFPRECRARFGVSDVVQETLMRAHQNIDQFRGTTEPDFRAWLTAILVNTLEKMREHHQRLKRGCGQEVSLNDSAIDVPSLDQPTPSAELAKKERTARVSAALQQLSADHRLVVELRNIEQLPFREIGLRMGRTEDAVQHLWCRAIRQLQLLLKSDA